MPNRSTNTANPESRAAEPETQSARERMSGAAPESAPASRLSSERISERAYQIYRDRGGEHGRDTEDWFTAERELNGTASEQE
jgi:hypothetical protein